MIGFDADPGAVGFADDPPPAPGTYCYRVDADDGTIAPSNLVEVIYDPAAADGNARRAGQPGAS